MKNLKSIPNSKEAIIETLADIRSQMAALKDREDDFKTRLYEAFAPELAQAYKEKGEPFGVVNMKEGDYKIVFTTPKKVKWDLTGLEKARQAGAPFVEVEYNIKETVFKDLSEADKDFLMQYRTVEPGSVNIKLERI